MTAHVLVWTTRCTPAARAAVRTLRVPSTFVRWKAVGSRCQRALRAATWKTASQPSTALSTEGRSVMSPWAISTPSPSSVVVSLAPRARARTSWPASTRTRDTWPPTKPVAPVTSALIGPLLPALARRPPSPPRTPRRRPSGSSGRKRQRGPGAAAAGSATAGPGGAPCAAVRGFRRLCRQGRAAAHPQPRPPRRARRGRASRADGIRLPTHALSMSTARAPVAARSRALSAGEATTSDAVSSGPNEVGRLHLRQGVPCATLKGVVRAEGVAARCVRPDDLLAHD